jgi:DNA-directed RNA polymerase subunit RPC12/RpoP
MSLFCATGGDDCDLDWWWYAPSDEAPLATKRSRKCCSCGQKISVGDTSRKVPRYRPATEFEEDRGIACDEVPMTDWYLCETCGDLYESITELGFCCQLGNGESLKHQIESYRRDEGTWVASLKREEA